MVHNSNAIFFTVLYLAVTSLTWYRFCKTSSFELRKCTKKRKNKQLVCLIPICFSFLLPKITNVKHGAVWVNVWDVYETSLSDFMVFDGKQMCDLLRDCIKMTRMGRDGWTRLSSVSQNNVTAKYNKKEAKHNEFKMLHENFRPHWLNGAVIHRCVRQTWNWEVGWKMKWARCIEMKYKSWMRNKVKTLSCSLREKKINYDNLPFSKKKKL